MPIDQFAPVIIPTLCRCEHFKRCVTTLSKCKYSDKTVLVIGLDYPLNESQVEGHKAIKDFIPIINGFKSVVVIEQKTNVGAIKNTEIIRNYVCEKFDFFIYSEDDNEFSPNFLEYINAGLIKYKDDNRVYSVTGYNYPMDMSGYDKNVYAYNACSAWGTGYWVKKLMNIPIEEMRRVAFSPFYLLKIYWSRPISVLNLAIMLYENKYYNDVCVGTKLILDNKVSIFPTVSKVRNHGHDGSGEHCGSSLYNLFEHQPIDQSIDFEYDEIPLKPIKWKPLDKYLSISFKAKIASLLFLIKVWLNKTKK